MAAVVAEQIVRLVYCCSSTSIDGKARASTHPVNFTCLLAWCGGARSDYFTWSITRQQHRLSLPAYHRSAQRTTFHGEAEKLRARARLFGFARKFNIGTCTAVVCVGWYGMVWYGGVVVQQQ